ncbi:MAG: hypothetical protein GXP39_16810 [Chloroflexi bacterium]|nr:hypothetical protein [Chloroflexota bacterium]
MRRMILTIAITVLLLSTLALAVSGQEGDTPAEPIIAQIQPLLINIQQQIPVSVTLSVPIGPTTTQTVTLPLVLDLNLQIGLADTVTATIETITTTEPISITVSEMAEEGEELKDNLGIPYELESTDGVEIIQWTASKNIFDHFQIVGELRNVDEEHVLDYVNLVVSMYDEDGKLLDVASGFMELDKVEPGGTSPFRVSTPVSAEDVARYLVQVEARFEK